MIICPICKNNAEKVAWTYQKYRIHHCIYCDLQFSYPMEAGDVAYYQGHETYKYLYDQVKNNGIAVGNKAIIKMLLESVNKYLSGSQLRAVDVGCGSGYLLNELKQIGFNCLGIDFNPEMINIAKEVFGLHARTASIDDLIYEGCVFDVAILSHVLEHISSPLEFLKKIKAILRPEGILFVAVPNRNFIRASKKLIRGTLPNANYPPHHVTFWSPKALQSVMEKTGYGMRECYAQIYPDAIQAEESIRSKLRIPDRLAKVISRASAFTGSLLRLEGVNIFAVGGL